MHFRKQIQLLLITNYLFINYSFKIFVLCNQRDIMIKI